MNWYLKVLKQYADFSGRARRKEYWMFSLFYFLFAIVTMILDFLLGSPFIITGIYMLAMFIPSLAVLVRRLHDIGKSGWWYFISLVPVIGGIWLLVLLVTDSQPGDNAYGPNPKEGPEDFFD